MSAFDDHIDHLLELANRRVVKDLSRVLSEAGVTREEWRVLEVLAIEAACSMGELAHAVAMNHPTLTKLIDKMVSKAWVHRSTDPDDSRRVLVGITDMGLAIVQRVHEPVQAHLSALNNVLGERGSRQLRTLLATLIGKH